MTFQKIFRYILIFEAILLNAGTGLLCLSQPVFFVGQFISSTAPTAFLEFIRWYGVLLWVLAYLVLRVLPLNDNRMLFPAVEALLFGDLVHLFAIYMFFAAQPLWSLAFIFMLISTLALAIIRSTWLYRFHKHLL